MRKAIAILLLALVVRGAVSSASAQDEIEIVPSQDSAKPFGEYPIAYKEIIERWLGTRLLDAPSAIVEWAEAPRAGEYKTKKGERYKGYIVDFKVNARNQFGSYTGKQKYRVVLRNGDIIWAGRPQ